MKRSLQVSFAFSKIKQIVCSREIHCLSKQLNVTSSAILVGTIPDFGTTDWEETAVTSNHLARQLPAKEIMERPLGCFAEGLLIQQAFGWSL
jgi:hypothetical protein